MRREKREEIVYNNAQRISCPLGEVQQAAYIWDAGGITSMRVLGNYVIVYLIDGAGMYRDARTVKSLTKGDLILLLPEWAHSYGPTRTQKWDEYYIVFRGPVFDFWRTTGMLNPNRPVSHLEPVSRWLDDFNAVFRESADGSALSQAAMICRLLTLLNAALNGEKEESLQTDPDLWVMAAKKRLSEFLNIRYDMDAIAAEFEQTYDSFRKRFQHAVGMTPTAFRMQRRIEAAQVLLEHSDLAHKEIAASLAFGDEFSFSRRFKAITGVSPKDFRKNPTIIVPPHT